MYGQILQQNQQYTPNDKKADYIKSDVIYSYDLDQTLDIFKKTAIDKGKNASNEFYSACLDRLDVLITERNSAVGKNEVVKILRDLAYFRPRDYDREDKKRKESGNLTMNEQQDDVLSVRHKQLIQKNSQKFQTVPGHVFGFLYEHVSKGLLKDLFTQYDEDQESKLGKSLYDVMALYIQLYENLQVRVIDMHDQIDAQEALDIMVSYSIAEEGSNNLYLKLIQTMLTKRREYNMVEVEMILNYFPHSIWTTEEDLKHLMEQFY